MPDTSTPETAPPSLPESVLAWLGDAGPKLSPGSEHGADPDATVARVMPVARRLGVTRLADITGLDDVGIPVATAYRPNARSLSVSQGKGPTPAAARASALMEAVEAAHAEQPRVSLRLAREAELTGPGDAVASPAQLPQRATGAYTDDLATLWVNGRSLATGEPVWVPFDAVHLDLTLPAGHGGWARPTSNGLASGNTIAEAVSHALCELVERDAATLWEVAGPDHQATTRLDPATVHDPTARRLLERCTAAGLDIALYDLTSDLGVPVVACHLADRERNPFRPLPAAGGVGCHPHPATAAVRAITEAAQSRLIDIAGARDDLFRDEHAARTDPDGPWTQPLPPLPAATRTFPAGPGDAQPTVAGDIALLVARLTAAGLAPVAVDLTDPALGVPVVRVVVPGLEGPPVAMAGGDMRPGTRSRAASRSGTVTRRTDHPAGDATGTPASTRVQRTHHPGRTRPVVFAGPTLPSAAVTARLDADVRPPAGQGDLARAAAHRPQAIVLIDGLYQGVPAVWHKEILWALSEGVPVYGAASMGALRAAELAEFGMVGVGAVYDDLRAGRITSDDEVAVAHAGPDDGFAALSVALVDIRATLTAAVTADVVPADDALTVAAAARSLFYPQRIWPTVLATARRAGLAAPAADTLAAWTAEHAVHTKRDDAEAVLDRVHADLATRPPDLPAATGDWRLARTDQWRRLEAELAAAGNDSDDPTGDELLDELRLHDDYFAAHQACLLAALAAQLAPASHPDSGDAASGVALDALRAGLGLHDHDELTHWAHDNSLSPERLTALARDQAAIQWAYSWGHDDAVRRIPDHLRLRGRYEPLAARLRARRHRRPAGTVAPHVTHAALPEDLWRWLAERYPATAHAPEARDAHARQLGFRDGNALRRAALRAYHADAAP